MLDPLVEDIALDRPRRASRLGRMIKPRRNSERTVANQAERQRRLSRYARLASQGKDLFGHG
jgi:hypothetical protein